MIFNATLLTMESGNEEFDLIPDGVMVVRGGVIDHVGAIGDFVAPTGATVIDAAGGTLIAFRLDCTHLSMKFSRLRDSWLH